MTEIQAERVDDLNMLFALCNEKRSVVCQNTTFAKPHSAAWMINLPGSMLHRLFQSGMYVYTPKQRGRKTKP